MKYSFMVGDQAVDSPEKVILMTGPHGKHEDIVATPIMAALVVRQQLSLILLSQLFSPSSAMLAPSPNIDMGSNEESARKTHIFQRRTSTCYRVALSAVGYGRMVAYLFQLASNTITIKTCSATRPLIILAAADRMNGVRWWLLRL